MNSNFSDKQAADIFIQQVKSLLVDLQIDTHIKGINHTDIPDLIKTAFTKALGIYAGSKYMNYADAAPPP